MPDLPSDPVQMMALLGDLNVWLTRVLDAYGRATPDEESVIQTEVRLMLSGDLPVDSDLVEWGTRRPFRPPLPFVGFPCMMRATWPLDEVIRGIEGRIHDPQ